ncbi:hypothetical protein PACTADRAFT_78689 [Pachysolen tannophilus NRRL Y-2460]|uniref:RRM domain-containing protein n=1 Tax=Pachysolen tannophilus NRRL Y-2460 TaxID=669874 RepID=A0A1E4U2R8_PACTA|nr:hypothetical protein PACTADRAFT_78689 [Pachysolen tannophilus NRRL Y-2460]
MSAEEQVQAQDSTIVEEKVYIGNVDYGTTEEELRELLTGYDIEQVELPKRTIRKRGKPSQVSLGYAFVTFKTKEEAAKVIKEFDNKVFKDREIYTRQALPPTEKKPKAKKPKSKTKKAPKKDDTADNATTTSSAATTDNSASEENGEIKPKSIKGSAKKSKPKKDKKPKQEKVPLEEGVPSKTTVFITNLDVEVTPKELREEFQELNPQWVSIPKKTIPFHIIKKLRKEKVPIKTRGRGIGFVRFGSEEDQKAAVAKMDKKEIHGKPITVAIAIDSNIPKETEENENENGNENEV